MFSQLLDISPKNFIFKYLFPILYILYSDLVWKLRYTVYYHRKSSSIFTITDTKLYVSGAILSTNDSAKLIKQLKSGFEKTINWNRYQSKVTT